LVAHMVEMEFSFIFFLTTSVYTKCITSHIISLQRKCNKSKEITIYLYFYCHLYLQYIIISLYTDITKIKHRMYSSLLKWLPYN
jgi:hypothetical protein